MSMTVPSYLLQFRGSWGEGKVAFCCGLRAQRPQGQRTGLPPGIFHILTTLHGLPRLELADPLPIFLLPAGLNCNALLPGTPYCVSCPDICSQRASWGTLTPASCTPRSKFATLSEADFYLNTARPRRAAQRMVWGGRLHSKTWRRCVGGRVLELFLVTLTAQNHPSSSFSSPWHWLERRKAVTKDRRGRRCQPQPSALCSWGGCEGRRAMFCHARDAFSGSLPRPTPTLLCSVPGLCVRRLDCANEITCGDNKGTGVKQCTPMWLMVWLYQESPRTTETSLVAQTRVTNAEVMLERLSAVILCCVCRPSRLPSLVVKL